MKESAKVLKDNDVVEHIFYHEWIGGGNGTHETHYYITRGRVGARKREKDAEERNNKITVELQLRYLLLVDYQYYTLKTVEK